MPDSEAKSLVSSILQTCGLQVEEVARSDTDTPDLRAWNPDIEYLIEIKQKMLDGRRGAIKVTPSGHMRSDPLSRCNTLSGIVEKAADQTATKASPETLRLMWFLPQMPHQDLLYKRLRCSLYGIRIASMRRPEGGSDPRECYYAGDSDFFRQSDRLDGVVVGKLNVVLLNDLSPRYEALRKSVVVQNAGAVEDPRREELAGNIFYLRSSVDRRDEQEVREALEEQYEAEFLELSNLISYSAVTHEPIEETSRQA